MDSLGSLQESVNYDVFGDTLDTASLATFADVPGQRIIFIFPLNTGPVVPDVGKGPGVPLPVVNQDVPCCPHNIFSSLVVGVSDMMSVSSAGLGYVASNVVTAVGLIPELFRNYGAEVDETTGEYPNVQVDEMQVDDVVMGDESDASTLGRKVALEAIIHDDPAC